MGGADSGGAPCGIRGQGFEEPPSGTHVHYALKPIFTTGVNISALSRLFETSFKDVGGGGARSTDLDTTRSLFLGHYR